jgi:predicted ATPase
MITQLSIKGFKTLKDVSLPLTRVSVLVGPNNCGKSNVLRALSFLGAIVREGLPDAVRRFGGPSEVFSRSGDGRLEIALEAKFRETTVHYRIGTAPNRC